MLRVGGIQVEVSSLRVGSTRDETPESDIDLLVDFPAGERGLFPLLRLAAEIESLVGRPVDVAAVEVMAEPARQQALAEAVHL
jgi:predicted nucleotidyltransferase